MPRPAATPARRLGKLPPLDPAMLCSRSIQCNLCGRKIFAGWLLAHKQTEHGDAIYTRTASGRPKGIWFRPPVRPLVRMRRRTVRAGFARTGPVPGVRRHDAG